ncbi:MAG: mechanosensitive ion channel [Sphingobacteriaceae bacterium]|nr:MAG: mechanosensitive ion channel [Sphingobacteriaceae bacterium]
MIDLHFFRFYKTYLSLSISFIFCLILNQHQAFSQEKTPVKTASDTAATIPDTLLFKIERAQNIITQINTSNKNNYNLTAIRTELPEIEANVNEVKDDVVGTSRIIEIKTLLSYQSILKGEQLQLAAWRETLSDYNNNLRKTAEQIIKFSTDTLLTPLAKDTSGKQLYKAQLTDLRQKLQQSGKLNASTLDSAGLLLAQVSKLYFEINSLQTTINEHLKQSGKTAFSKESPYLWSAPPITTTTNLGKLFRTSYQGQNRILLYFINNTWDNRLLLILVGTAFFIWVFRNFKIVNQLQLNPKLSVLKFNYIGTFPLLATLIVVLNITPLFEPASPPSYIELIQLALLFVLTLFFRKRIKAAKFKFWLLIVALYIIVSITIAVINYGLILRCGLIMLNLVSGYIGLLFYKNIDRRTIPKRYLKPIMSIYLLLNGFAILLNFFGRISLAKVFSQTAVSSLIQVVGLAVFVHIISESLELQIRISSCSEGFFSKINFVKVRKTVRRVLSIVAVLLWLLVFFINLNFSGALFTMIETLLNKQRTFGKIDYTLGNILLFGIIIYVSLWLQKNVGILFGENNSSFTDKLEHKSSKLALVRLIVIVIGFFAAITASGFPVDKLTVVLGALSVGIGLGMQNIVNNFVSGIILIFERPFQIGDFVELADKKGKVLDIGIRASRMLTPQGSEVIVPNGDLLSGRLVNWTLSNSYLKTEFLLKISSETDIENVKKLIETVVVKADNTVKNMPVEILFNAIGAESIELKVEVWINSIYSETSFKGKVLEQMYTQFKQNGIKMM